MTDPFLAEIRMIAWNYPARYWAFCDGATLAIATNQALFALLGTTYGGNGSQTFQLPDLRARTPVGASATLPAAAVAGEPKHVLTNAELPPHAHQFFGTATAGTGDQPNRNGFIGSYESAFAPYPLVLNEQTSFEPSDIGATGGGVGHENRQPYVCINFMIALSGIFPSRN